MAAKTKESLNIEISVPQTLSWVSVGEYEVMQEQIDIWKRQHGSVYQLTAEDGKSCLVKDPFSSLMIMKKAMTALDKSEVAFVTSIISDCFLTGDTDIRDKEGYAEGLFNQVFELVETPDATIERDGSKYKISCEGCSVEVRQAKRGDVQIANSKNPKRLAYETNIHLLQRIALSGLDELKKNTRAYLGVLSSLEEVKEKVAVSVKKL